MLQMEFEVVEEIIYGLESGILFGYCSGLHSFAWWNTFPAIIMVEDD